MTIIKLAICAAAAAVFAAYAPAQVSKPTQQPCRELCPPPFDMSKLANAFRP